MKYKDSDLLRHIQSRLTPVQVRDYLLQQKPSQLYLCIDMKKYKVTLAGVFTNSRVPITTFYRCPSLAEAVIRARKFCSRYYESIPVLEYNVQ